jgi:hypothetical protein
MGTDGTTTTNIPGVLVQPLLARGHWDEGASYAGSHSRISIGSAAGGDYTLLLSGPENATIALTAEAYDSAGTSTASGVATVGPNTVTRYRVHHTPGDHVTLSYVGTTDVAAASAPTDIRMAIMPNPIKAHGQIALTLDVAQLASVEMYDVSGRQVTTIAKGTMAAGVHRYDVRAEQMKPGIYFVRLRTATRAFVERVVLLGGQ